MTEKRTTSARSGTAAKENHSSTGRHHRNQAHQQNGQQRSGKGIEILDFHESWLEEVELYKDKMVMAKKLTNQNHVPTAAHHLFSAPNRNQGRISASTPQHRSTAGGGSVTGGGLAVAATSVGAAASVAAAAAATASTRSSPPAQKHPKSPPSPRKRQTPEKISNNSASAGDSSKVTPQKVGIRGNPTPAANSAPKSNSTPAAGPPIVANSVLQSESYKKVQVSV